MNIINREKKLLLLISFVIFSLFFLSFLNIKLWDFDFWWHIATGRYIVDNQEIPSHDKFSYLTEHNRELFKATGLREEFLMRQYWLAQVLFYYLYIFFGSWGIVVMRSLLLTLTLWLVYKGLRKFGVPELLSLSMLIPVFYVLLNKYTGERPVLFSFVFAVLVFLIIEDFLKSKGKTIYFLPPVMLLWSNLHGGFILGIVFITIYLTIESFKFIFKKSEFSKNKFYLFSLIMMLSLFSSFLNPNGLITILMFQPKYEIFTADVQEYRPLLELYLKKVFMIDYSLFFIIGISIITLILRLRKMQLSHLILLSGLLIMSFLHQRYFVFSATIGTIIIGKEITVLYRNWSDKCESLNYRTFQKIVISLMVLFILLFTVKTTLAFGKNVKNFSRVHSINSERYAIEFIEKNKIPGRMFNTDVIGGYAVWKLYPWKQVFTDTRAINIASVVEYKTIISAKHFEAEKKPLWERLLEMYDVNFVLIDPLDYYGKLVPLIKALNDNERWVLIYTDSNFLIFLRNSEENKEIIERFRLRKEDGYWSIIAKASFMAINKTDNPFLFSTIGECFMKLQNYNEAEKAFKHVLRIDPDNKEAAEALSKIHNIKEKEEKKKG